MVFWKIQRRLGKLVESLSWGSGALDVLRHEVGVENLVTANKISHCDDYLIIHGCVQIASLRSSGYGFLEDSKEAWEASRELVLGKWGRHEVGVENLVTANKISHCDDYLISD
ncbi:hypothetical protein Lser_V15G28867 [Lactuca serriola]